MVNYFCYHQLNFYMESEKVSFNVARLPIGDTIDVPLMYHWVDIGV